MSTHATYADSIAIAHDARASEHAIDLGRIGRNLGALALAALPGLLTLFVSFNAGGFYPGAQGVVVAVLAGSVALRMAFVRHPFAGFGWPLRIAVGALALYSLWSLASAHWSHSPGRALLDFNLVNVYVFVLILFGSSSRSHRRVRWTVILTWLSMLFVCIAALATRLRPDLFPIPANMSPNRLAYPLTYWNALGLFGVIGLILGVYFASSTREPRSMRVLATATLPVFCVAILFTYSRAAIILGPAALVLFALLARPRGLLGALIAGGPTSAFMIAQSYQAKLISNAVVSPAAVAQGRHLTTSLLLACAAAALARVPLLEFDTRLAKISMSSRTRHNARILLALGCGVAAIALGVAFSGQIATQWKHFTRQDSPLGADVRQRINDISISSRLPGWKIALKSFDSSPIHGLGAGTYSIDYYRLRNTGGVALQAHSLYFEAMGELGVVGLVAIVTVVVLLTGACFMRSRRTSRSLWIALGTVALVWAVHAGVDWDWEMPAVTLPVFALAAAGLARRGGHARVRPRYEIALRVLIGLAAVAVVFVAVRTTLSDEHLDRAVAEFNGGNCPAAVADARATISAVSSRPQPYQIIGLCDVVTGNGNQAVGLLDQAVARDPQSWLYQYSLAIALAAAGKNPRPALQRAELLDPLEQMTRTAAATFSGNNPRRWERAASHTEMLVTTSNY